MSEWTSHNNLVVTNGVRMYLAEVQRWLTEKLRAVAKMMVDIIDGKFTPVPPHEPGGNNDFPVWRGHLHDATGVGLYINGRTEYFMPTHKAIKYQTSRRMKGVKIHGTQFLMQAITQAAARFSKGIWIVLFSAVPYAEEVNLFGSPMESGPRGVGFFDKTTAELTALIASNLKPIAV